jgi:signal transduction histidine kinase
MTLPYSRTMLRELATARRIDVLVAAGLFAWAAPDVPWWWKPPTHVPGTPVILGYLVLALASTVPFLWRRRFPVLVLALTAAVLITRHLLHQHEAAASAAVLVAAYGLGAYATEARRSAPQWLGWLSLIIAMVIGVTFNDNRMAGVPFALVGAAFLVGDAATARRNEVTSAVEAAHLAERTLIARELHDVLAHQLSTITVQTGVARMTGSHSAEVLATVEQLSREALTELNHLLGALRRDDEGDPDRRPAPSLAAIGTLLKRARDAGVPTDLVIAGRVRDLTPGLQLSAYRIVQESLTNVAKHAPGAATLVTLRYLDDHLALEVVNGRPEEASAASGPAAAGRGPERGRPVTGGRGLLGMRERAELYDGDLHASATSNGFKVTAALPYGGCEGSS